MWRRLIFNAPRMVGRRKLLRNTPTEAESILWNCLRKSQLGFKFTRQYSIDNYVLDFYCPEKKISIELDGRIHNKTKTYDEYRSRTIKTYGILELRFENEEVFNNLKVVVEKILQNLGDGKIQI